MRASGALAGFRQRSRGLRALNSFHGVPGAQISRIVKQMPLPVIKNTRLQLIPVAQTTDGNPIHMMLPDQLRLL